MFVSVYRAIARCKKPVITLISNNSGYALVLVLLLLMLATCLVVPSLVLTTTTLQSSSMIENKTMSFYAADAGIEYALWNLQYNTELDLPEEGDDPLTLDFPDPTINGNTMSINISNEGEYYTLTSSATNSNAETITVNSDVKIGHGTSVFDFAGVALGGDGECDVNLGGNSDIEADVTLEGNIYAVGDICLSGNAEVDGDAIATGDVNLSGNADVNGDITENDTNPPSAPSIEIDTFKTETQAATCPLCSSWTDSPDLIVTNFDTIVRSTITCIERDLIVSSFGEATFEDRVKVGRNIAISTLNSATFEDVVCVTGNVIVSSNAEAYFMGPVKIGGDLTLSSNKDVIFGNTLFVAGDMNITSNIDVYINGTIYVQGNFINTGNANLIGGDTIIVDGNITLTGNSDFNVEAEDIPLFISTQGDIIVTGNSSVAAILYAMDGDAVLSGNSDVYGAVVANTITGLGNNDLVYPIGLRDREDLHGGISSLQIITFIIQKE